MGVEMTTGWDERSTADFGWGHSTRNVNNKVGGQRRPLACSFVRSFVRSADILSSRDYLRSSR